MVAASTDVNRELYSTETSSGLAGPRTDSSLLSVKSIKSLRVPIRFSDMIVYLLALLRRSLTLSLSVSVARTGSTTTTDVPLPFD
jgi:hypothetical protein